MTTAIHLKESLSDLKPIYIDLINESMNHAGYFAGKESHFKLTIVSDEFIGVRPVARHQKVYALIAPLLTTQGGSVHALAIHAYTTDEWRNNDAPASPQCAGQNKANITL